MRYLICSIFILQSIFIFSQNNENFSCEMATDLQMGDNCLVQSNTTSTSEYISSCSENSKKDIWFHFVSNQNSLVSIEAKLTIIDSLFNNAITVYTGACGNLAEVVCVDKDEHGFLGEKVYLSTNPSTDYYVKVSGLEEEFGRLSGLSCIALKIEDNEPEVTPNDLCSQAATLTLNDEWKSHDNFNASLEGEYLSSSERNRADVWFAFTPEVDTDIKVESLANFSHSIHLYDGDCDNISLLKGSLSGFELLSKDLIGGHKYFLRISGSFASLEGDFDIKISSVMNENVENVDCFSSSSYVSDCLIFSTLASSFSGQYPSCLFYAQNDIWFDYVPTQSGTHALNVKADFLSSVAVYRNNCDNLEEIFCGKASTCDGALAVKNLVANQSYLIQVLTSNEYFINEGGQGCLEIVHISDYDFIPLDLDVQTVCVSENLAKLKVDVKNGGGNYSFNGNVDGEELNVGDSYFVQVTDQNGCQQIAHGTVTCDLSGSECQLFYDLEITDFDCNTQSGGVASIAVYGDDDYSISWPFGSTENTSSNLQPGEYSLALINNVTNGTCTVVFEIEESIETYQIYYADADNDSFGDPNNFIESCYAIEGYVDNSNDCDDLDAQINLSMVEIPYNGIDDDCDSDTLDDDLDQDGFNLIDDCDDTDSEVNSSQAEIPYNGIDDDCDPSTLDDDLDEDGFNLIDDCDDTDSEVNANQTEIPYNGMDDDCDSDTLDDDLDQDGFNLADDCDDMDSEVNSSQTEVPYNGVDDDCDPSTLDDDLDEDGFIEAEDCDDLDSNINPSIEEIPNNGIDENCDGVDLITSTIDFSNGSVEIFPNPTSDRLNVTGLEGQNYRIDVYNISGILVVQNIKTHSFSVDQLISGTYLLKLIDLDTGEFIIEKVFVL